MLLIPSPGGKLIKQDPVFERIAYAPYFASGRQVYASHSASRREAYYTRSGIRTDSLCSFIWPPAAKFMLLLVPPGGKLIIQDQVSERIPYARHSTARPPLADFRLASSERHVTCIIQHCSCCMIRASRQPCTTTLHNHSAQQQLHWQISAGVQCAAYNMYHETQFMSHVA
jgi:hypothetical protein